MIGKTRFLAKTLFFCAFLATHGAAAQSGTFSERWSFPEGKSRPCGETFVTKEGALTGRLCKERSVDGYYLFDPSTGKGETYEGVTPEKIHEVLYTTVDSEVLWKEYFAELGYSLAGNALYSLSTDRRSLLKTSRDRKEQEVVYRLNSPLTANFTGIPTVVQGDDGFLYAPLQQEVGAKAQDRRCRFGVLRFAPDGSYKKVLLSGSFNSSSFCYLGYASYPRRMYDGSLFIELEGIQMDPSSAEQLLLMEIAVFGTEWKVLGRTSPLYTPPDEFFGAKFLKDGRFWFTRGYLYSSSQAYGSVGALNPFTSELGQSASLNASTGIPMGEIIETPSRRAFIITEGPGTGEQMKYRVLELLPGEPKAPNVTGFTLVNAETGEELPDYRNVQGKVVLSLANLPAAKLGIKAVVDSAGAESVVFGLRSNQTFRVDNEVPFSLFTAGENKYYRWTPQRGTYPITATAYVKDHGGGVSGKSASLFLMFTQ